MIENVSAMQMSAYILYKFYKWGLNNIFNINII